MKHIHIASVISAAILSSMPTAQAQIRFDAAQTYGLAALRPDAVAAADFDGVNGPDLAVTTGSGQGSNGPDWVEIFMNQGGSFAAGQQIFMGNNVSTAAIIAADLDADGDADLAVSMKNTNMVQVLINTGGFFTLGPATATGGFSPAHMACGDIDGDGDLDLITSNRDSNNLSLLLNNGAGAFSAAGTVAVGIDPRYLVLSDLNGDCDLDIAVASHDSRRVDVIFGNGAGGFSGMTSYPTPGNNKPSGMAAADLDGDGDNDLVTSTDQNDLGQLCVMMNQGGTFSSFCFFIGGANPSAVVACDLDADGDIDLATAGEDTGSVRAVANLGGGVFGAATVVAVGAHPSDLIATDLDGNGSLDLVTPNRDSNNMSVLMNSSSGGTETYCVSSPNSAGPGALIGSSGSLSVTQNSFTLSASCCASNQNGIFFYGPAQTNVAFGNGRRCVAGPFFRLNPPSMTDASGNISRPVDFTAPPSSAGPGQISAGSTFFFQFWYRDPAGGGSAFNTSNGLRATFTP